MKTEHRVRVMELAANRGEKGFSGIVAEALDLYLEAQKSKQAAIKKALALKGSMGDAETNELRTKTRVIRENWR